jgi:ribonuclease VapC
MILDSSALMAIINDEPGSEDLIRALGANTCSMSVATWLEVCIVADARSATHGERLDRLLEGLGTQFVEVTRRQAEIARVAYRRFGRGSGSPAQLNFGDCFAYALSVTTGEPLLFVGDDFPHTDVSRARF